jgi:cobalt/nickel transport system permease protein
VQFTIIYISKIPVLYIIKRALLISPLVLPVILLNTFFKDIGGVEISIIFTLRAFLSIITLLLLLSTTKFYSILKTLEKWKSPNILIIILSFMYRYFFLLQDELERMIRSLKLRSCNIKKTLLFRYYTNIIGILFIKSYDRAERVFQAMELRGYEDDFKR